MTDFPKQLALRWRERLKATGRKPQPGSGALRRHLRRLVPAVFYFRIIGWGFAVLPFPTGWQIFALLVTVHALVSARQILVRGQDEFLLSLYGASDEALLEPTRKIQRQKAIWAAVDAAVVLGIWWWLVRVPGWSVLLGVPAYTLGVMIGPRLLAAVIPGAVWRWLGSVGLLGSVVLVILLSNSQLPPSFAEGMFVLAGWLSPAGWVVLMLRGLLEGRPLLWGILLLLGAAAVMVRSLARRQDESLIAAVTEGRDPDTEEPPPGETDSPALPGDETQEGKTEFADAWEHTPTRSLLDLPPNPSHGEPARKSILWNIAILLGLAVLNRPEFAALGALRHLVLGAALGVAFTLWMPLLGIPPWLWQCHAATGRTCSVFAFFPIPFRRLLKEKIVADLRRAGRALPVLILLVLAVIVIAFTPPWPFAVVCAVTPPLAVFLFLPLCWFRLAFGVQGTKPFRLSRLVLNGAIVVMAILFLAEVVLLIVLFYLTFGEVLEPGAGSFAMAITILVLGLLNALAGLAGTAWSVRTYERGRFDLIKVPDPARRS